MYISTVVVLCQNATAFKMDTKRIAAAVPTDNEEFFDAVYPLRTNCAAATRSEEPSMVWRNGSVSGFERLQLRFGGWMFATAVGQCVPSRSNLGLYLVVHI